jgi:hypothetical protein
VLAEVITALEKVRRWCLSQVVVINLQRVQVLSASAILLAACGSSAVPPAEELVREVLARREPRAVRAIGYLTRDAAGVRLVGELHAGVDGFVPGGQVMCLDAPAGEGERLIALAPEAPAAAVAAVSGTLSPGPGACSAMITNARAELLAPRETTIATLVQRPQEYDGAVVRVAGGLLARPGAALLVEQLGAGGVPAPGTQQIKLVVPLADGMLPQALGRSPSGDVRFGPVLVEGFWRNGALVPLVISAVVE